MIGQKRLLDRLDHMVENGLPRFIIIAGIKGSGKKLLTREIAKRLEAEIIEIETKVDAVRQVIELAYKQINPVIYLISDADRMSIAAKNALLKITEEPPRKAYFIMTLEDLSNTLGTLKSRGTVVTLDPYTSEELIAYSDLKEYDLNSSEIGIMTQVCTVPGEIDRLLRYNIEDFYAFVDKVLNNIGKVNGANAFKIGSAFAYKEGDSGWDISLFFRTMMYICRERLLKEKDSRFRDTIRVSSKYLSQLSINGVNKSSTMDMWILETRGIWITEEE